MRNKGQTIKKIDEAQNGLELCIKGLINRSMTPEEILDKLNVIKDKLSNVIVLINTNNETP